MKKIKVKTLSCSLPFESINSTVIYRNIALKNDYSFLFENLKYNGKTFSVIGVIPEKIIRYGKNNKDSLVITLKEGEEKEIEIVEADYLSFLEKELDKICFQSIKEIPPFFCSFFGYFGYEMIYLWEGLLYKQTDKFLQNNDLPLSILCCPKMSLIMNHEDKMLHIFNCLYFDNEETADEIEESVSIAQSEIDNLKENIIEILKIQDSKDTTSDEQSYSKRQYPPLNITYHTKKEDFLEQVKKAIEQINSSGAFQIVLSQKFSTHIESNPFEIYEVLRAINPSPYMFYLNFPEAKILGCSPEMLVKVERGEVISRPLAGTRTRGQKAEEDTDLEQELLNDEKEKAEHVMLVDLTRNDLGKVCKRGSVKVTQLFGIEKYSHVMHIYSQVEGVKREDVGLLEILKSVFPAGTVSGAPKIKAIELIEILEAEPREVYAGSIGYITPDGDLDAAIAIRTIVCKGSEAFIQSGAGIVSYSIPEKEYEETLNKAKAMFKAIEIAEYQKTDVQNLIK
ncbi:MAG TPA: anthranilate synthase component I family protein [Defluviitoga sp.]|nr:anthranilate synthase component I family protein [Defluviitoga sp.]